MAGTPQPLPCTGVVLAGGAGRRLGGDKALMQICGRPLLAGPLEALRKVCRPVAVVARAQTKLPPLDDPPPVWLEADGPRHPVTGVVHALQQAGGRPVLVCAVDMPLLDAATLRIILTAAAVVPDAPVVVPQSGGHLHVLCALYRQSALPGLQRFDPGARAVDLVSALGPAVIPFEDDTPFFNVNAPEDVLQAEALLAARRGWWSVGQGGGRV
ncbi:MAG: molybdenum cofactor guanylyltransferase [Solirubrobacterales bacterium]|nr:molybdenum cofactor guanylyltransferase [Solirubrobacterales bacterium]